MADRSRRDQGFVIFPDVQLRRNLDAYLRERRAGQLAGRLHADLPVFHGAHHGLRVSHEVQGLDSRGLDDLADISTVSPSHLIRLFKRQMGTTPHDYLMRYRITRAKELLAETALTSATIARQVGFSSESNFSYRFSKVVGQSPREYRQSTPDLVLEG